MSQLKIVVAQLNLLVGDIEGNTERMIAVSQRFYEKHKADLVIFPELAITSYPPEDLLFRPNLYRRVNQGLRKLAEQTAATSLIVGYPEKDALGHCFNKAAFISQGKIISSYAKQKLPNYTVFDEKRYFTAGKEARIFDFKGVKIGILICEDLWFKTPIQKTIALGAELIICINASPFAQDKSHARRELIAARALENKIPIIYANLVGGQDEIVFDGGSLFYNAKGELCQQANYFSEDEMIIQFDLASNMPRTPLIPEPLEEEKIYHALVLGVRDYIQKNKFPGAIIGLSGGIDSALTLAIAVDAIGAEKVEAVLMPSRFTSEESLIDAKEQIRLLKTSHTIINIEPIFCEFLNALKNEFLPFPWDATEENLQARCRGTLLMALSNKKGAIVLTTGNKSEMAVGYATLYGDMAGGFAVLKDIYKTMVYRLAHYRNTQTQVIPQRVLEKAPSAELAFNQKDADTLPPYPILDDILNRYIAQEEDPDTISQAGFDIKLVRNIIQRINQNEYKRRQAPVGIRISERAFGKDRRYPITSGFSKA